MNSIRDLIADSHARAKRKGWWDDCRDDRIGQTEHLLPAKVRAQVPEKLALIHSEISEALECYRKGDMETHYVSPDYDPCAPIVVVPPSKPEGFPIELADVVIRCADLLGALGHEVGALEPEDIFKNVPHALCRIHAQVSDAYMDWQRQQDCQRQEFGTIGYGLSVVIDYCFSLATDLGIDLWAAIETKAKYNETRSWRHGGRKC